MEEYKCPICFELMKKTDTFKTKCHHNFHKNCIDNWLNDYHGKSCPVCRTQLSEDDEFHTIIYIYIPLPNTILNLSLNQNNYPLNFIFHYSS